MTIMVVDTGVTCRGGFGSVNRKVKIWQNS